MDVATLMKLIQRVDFLENQLEDQDRLKKRFDFMENHLFCLCVLIFPRVLLRCIYRLTLSV